MSDGRSLISSIFELAMFPISESVVEELWSVVAAEGTAYRKRLEHYSLATNVVVNTASMGLGDAIKELGHSLAAARQSPNKSFTIVVPRSLLNMQSLEVSDNVALTAELPAAVLRHPGTFLLSYNYALNVVELWPTWRHRGNWSADIHEVTHVAMNRASECWSSSVSDMALTANALGVDQVRLIGPNTSVPVPPSTHGEMHNGWDLLCCLLNASLGMSVAEACSIKPVLDTRRMRAARTSTFDLIVAPDAAGVALGPEGRSFKSLTPESWADIASGIDGSLALGIVKGLAHEQYSDAVAEAVFRVHEQTEYIDAPTLDEFCDAVAVSRMFVGCDSGTSHLAAELASCLPTLDLRVIFNGEVADARFHGVRIMERVARLLVYYSPWRRQNSCHTMRHSDIAAIRTGDVRAFLS